MKIAVGDKFLTPVGLESADGLKVIVGSEENAIEFKLLNMENNLVSRYFIANTKYALAAIISDTLFVLHYDSNQSLFLVNERNKNTLGRVYVQIPENMRFGEDVSRFIFTENNNGTNYLVWNSILNQVRFIQTDAEGEVIVNECTPDCAGKKCNEDNGCGAPCGCGIGNICRPDGLCEIEYLNQQDVRCNSNDCGGSCYGKCGQSSNCNRIDGRYRCERNQSIYWILLLILIFIILIFIGLRNFF